MLTESEAMRLWQQLFRGQEVTELTYAEAQSVLNEMPPESPLRARFDRELHDIRKLHQQRAASPRKR